MLVLESIMFDDVVPEIAIQKIKLPYPFHMPNQRIEQDMAYIECWSPDTVGRLMIRHPASNQKTPGAEFVETLSLEDSKLLLNHLGLCEGNVPGWKPPKKKKNMSVLDGIAQVERISAKEWNEFQRWKNTKEELEELADENLNTLKSALRYVEIQDDEIDDLVEGLRRAPRLVRYIRTGSYPPDDLEDDDMSYYDESIMLGANENVYTPKHEIKETKFIVEVHIEDISDGKL